MRSFVINDNKLIGIIGRYCIRILKVCPNIVLYCSGELDDKDSSPPGTSNTRWSTRIQGGGGFLTLIP